MDNKRKIRWATMIPLIGGSAIGCEKAIGYKPEFHLSYNAFTGNEVHLLNYWKDVKMYKIDSEEFDLDELKKNHPHVDIVNSVCPCAGLSRLSASASPDSKMNDWMYNSSEFVLDKIKPMVLWGENAPALATTTGRKVAMNLSAIGRKYGYAFSMIKTNAMDHGLPQNRQRTFYFFWKGAVCPILGYHKTKMINFPEFLNRIPDDLLHQDLLPNTSNPVDYPEYKFICEKTGLKSTAEIVKRYKRNSYCGVILMEFGAPKFIEWLKEQPYDTERLQKRYEHIIKKFDDEMGIMDASPRFTTTYLGSLVGHKLFTTLHPTKNRFLTVRESMRMMGLPDDFELVDGVQNLNHIVQNVPTPAAKAMMTEVLRFVNRDETMLLSNSNFMIQDNTHKRIVENRCIWK